MSKMWIVTFASFLLLFPLIGESQSGNIDFPNSTGFTVDLKEWFVLEVSTDSETLASYGNSMADVASTLRLEENPVQIRAHVSVARGRTVELRVQALGDLISPQGNTLPVSQIAWRGSGNGFFSGSLSNSEPVVIARWVGSGLRQGSVQYYATNGGAHIGDLKQKVVYSLSAI
jgi:hypothetical protein